jgi:hypothetical protein
LHFGNYSISKRKLILKKSLFQHAGALLDVFWRTGGGTGKVVFAYEDAFGGCCR